MPRRSTGCERCRKRKVRCDEQKPQCQKCIDYGVECSGYRPPAERDLRFVDQTNFVARKGGNETLQQRRPTNENNQRQYQWRNQYYVAPKSHGPSDISKGHVHRVQLLSTFLDLYLPKRNDKSMTSHFNYIAHLPQIDLASPLLQVSIDTLCLAELGSLYQDERCLHESQARYVRALPMLANELARPSSKQMRQDHILAAINILTLCELFDAIAPGSGEGQGWLSHVNGAQQYIKAIGPKRMDSHFGWLLFHNMRHSSMCMGFVKRQAAFFARPEWLNVTSEIAKHDQYVALYDIALQIPTVLECFDNMAFSLSYSDEGVSVGAEICRLRDELETWLQKFYINRSIELYKIVDVRDMEEFARLCLDRTFQTVFSFNSVQSCTQQQLYWICCLTLDFTFLAICRRFAVSDIDSLARLEDLTTRSEEDIRRDLYVTATSYCRSIPFCCEAETASVGRIGTFLLRIVQNYFDQSGHCRESEWCGAVRQMLQSYSQPPKNHQEKDGDAPGAPWNVKHRCKSPICNFRIECVAPAPLLLAGEYPNKAYAPRHDSREPVFDQALPQHDPVQGVEELTYLGGTVRHAKQSWWHKDTRKRHAVKRVEIPAGVPKQNGTSVLADERILSADFVPKISI